MALTWKQFKDKMESVGVKDDTEIYQIDLFMPMKTSDFEAEIHGGNLVTVSDEDQ